MTDTNVQQAATRLGDAFARAGAAPALSWIWRPLLRLLARGEPVPAERIAAVTGRPAEQVREVLPTLPGIELDDTGAVVGYGITLCPTPHRFEVDGRALYTWCALDTLILPAVLGRPARVASPCHGTGTPVRVTVEPAGVTSVDPPESVVSIVTPEDVSDVRTAFCHQVHFFASPAAAQPWLAQHQGGTVLTVAEAFDLGRDLSPSLFADAGGTSCC